MSGLEVGEQKAGWRRAGWQNVGWQSVGWRRVAAAGALTVGATSLFCTAAEAQERPGRTPRALYDSRLSTRATTRTAKQADPVDKDIQLTLTSRYSFAPASVRSLVRIAPHPDNRTLRVAVDSPSYFRSSDVELDGERAALNHFFSWRSLPPGNYEVIVTVLGPDGPRAESRLPFEVLGPNSLAP
jgi:hypothetical protein